MPSFDTPIITLGGLFLAGNRAPEYTGGETGMNLVAGGFASASADWAVNQTRSTLNIEESTVSDELAQAILGAGMSRFGEPIPRNNAMSRAILYDVAQQGVAEAGFAMGDLMGDGGFFNGGNGDNGSNGSSTQPVRRSPSRNTGTQSRVY